MQTILAPTEHAIGQNGEGIGPRQQVSAPVRKRMANLVPWPRQEGAQFASPLGGFRLRPSQEGFSLQGKKTGAATPVRSFRVMGMRRVSVPKSINQSEIRPKFVLRPPVGKWNGHACMLLSRDCARRTVRFPNQFRLARSHSMPDALSIV